MRRIALLAIGIWTWPALAMPQDAEPRLAFGVAKVVYTHFAYAPGVRLGWRWAYLDVEYLFLQTADHTDHGFVAVAGLQMPGARRIRPHVGVGGGPVSGPPGDEGLLFGALGARWYPTPAARLFVMPELRAGIFGESFYAQYALNVGLEVRRR